MGTKVKELSHTLREYRNLVHADAELEDKGLRVNAEEADLATVILRIVHRDLSAAPRWVRNQRVAHRAAPLTDIVVRGEPPDGGS